MSGRDRALIMFRFDDMLNSRAKLAAEVMALDNGQPRASCVGVEGSSRNPVLWSSQ